MNNRILVVLFSSLLLLNVQSAFAQQGQTLCAKLQKYAAACLLSSYSGPCVSRKVPNKLQTSIKKHLLNTGQPEHIESSIQKFKSACLLACKSAQGQIELPREDLLCTSLKLPK